MNAEQLIEKCTAWLDSRSSEEFAVLVGASLPYQKDFAVEFEVAESTVTRWSKGTARPHPLIQKQIMNSILRRARG